jgi:hypothetical protein
MTITVVENTQAVDTTEWSCPRDASYDIAQTQTDDCVVQVFLDVSDMITGDELQIRIYEKVQSTDTQRILYQSNLVGPQSPPIWVSPSLVLVNGWDVTLDAIAGTITVTWSIRKIS